ncbi:MAG TPA: PLP-dependent aminotransferase family protein [Kofleriaceae bacterium]|nr:PLP-dependent aminotransferase family protein [Kofleriaceae bacterium]
MNPRIAELQKAAAGRPDVIGLAGGLPADELMPRRELAQVLAEVAAKRSDALQYGWPEGTEKLRTWIADRLATRGAPVDPARVIVTAGAQQALSIVGAAHRGERIDVGEATYPAAIAAFRQAGAHVVSRDGELHYLMAGIANPYGVDTLEARRADMLVRGGALVVDEAYAELRFDGALPRPLLPDAPQRVWHIGTFSKTVCPGLRVGWLVPPAREHDSVLDIKAAADLQTASISQAAVVRLLGAIDYDALVARARGFYRRRAAVLAEALHRHLRGVRFTEPEGGFSIWVQTDDGGDDIALLEAAIAEGVCIDPGSMFRLRGETGPVAFRASYSNTPPDKLEEGARRLAKALERWRSRT